MNGKDAEARLAYHTSDNCYLTRLRDNYKISVKYYRSEGPRVKHFVIEKDEVGPNQYTYSIKDVDQRKKFDSVPQLLEYYEKEALNQKIPSLGECVKPGDSQGMWTMDLPSVDSYYCLHQ